MKNKKIFKRTIAILMAATLVVGTTAIENAEAKKAPALNKKKVTLQVGEKFKLKVKKASDAKKITFKSTKKKVASVSKKGKIKAKAEGKTKVKVKVVFSDGSKVRLKCKVTVKNNDVTQTSTTSPSSVTINNYYTSAATPQIIYVTVPHNRRESTEKPAESALPAETESAKPDETEASTKTPDVTEGPKETDEAKVTTEPAVTDSPEETEVPEATATPGATATPDATATPVASDSPEGNVKYQGDVTREMTSSDYWANKCDDSDEVLIELEDILKVNDDILKSADTNMNDLLNVSDTYNGDSVKNNLTNAITNEVQGQRFAGYSVIYSDGVAITDVSGFFEDIKTNISTAETTSEDHIKYGLCTNTTVLKMAPVAESIGFYASDSDDEMANSGLNVNDPVTIIATTADGNFYYVNSIDCYGWVESKDIAICMSKDEWKEMWSGNGEDFLYVTERQITLAASNLQPETSNLQLMFATKLPLVSEEELVDKYGNYINLGERSIYYNYVVYVPTRDTNGNFVKSIALISMSEDVSIGEVPFTQRNVLNVAFKCLGDRYGWGGMLNANDCSQYVRRIYRCFGFELPRNTTWQSLIPTDRTNLSGMTADEKAELIKDMEPGTILFFNGHEMMYIGEDNGKLYVISALGGVAESADYSETTTIQSIYSVAINSLNVRRRNGNTWLQELNMAVRPFK